MCEVPVPARHRNPRCGKAICRRTCGIDVSGLCRAAIQIVAEHFYASIKDNAAFNQVPDEVELATGTPLAYRSFAASPEAADELAIPSVVEVVDGCGRASRRINGTSLYHDLKIVVVLSPGVNHRRSRKAHGL